MTSPSVLDDITQPIPAGIPDHTQSSGESGFAAEGKEEKRSTRPGIFGRDSGTRRPKLSASTKPRKEPIEVPKLGPHMRQKITDFYILVGGLVTPIDPLAGQTIIEQAPLCGKAVYDFANSNAAFRRVISAFLTTSMVGALVFAHLPIILVLARHARNEGVRITAASMMVAMKLMSKDDAEEVFNDIDEPASEGVA